MMDLFISRNKDKGEEMHIHSQTFAKCLLQTLMQKYDGNPYQGCMILEKRVKRREIAAGCFS